MTYSRWRNRLFVLHLIQLACAVVSVTGFSENALGFYMRTYLFFPLSSAWCAYLLGTTERNRSNTLLYHLAIGWTLLQPVDYYVMTFTWREHLTPSVLTMLTLGLVHLSTKARGLAQRADSIGELILARQSGFTSLPGSLSQVAEMLKNVTRYQRASVYVDAYFVGANERPGEALVRIFADGYDVLNPEHARIAFSDDQGLIMKEALREGRPRTRRGLREEGWYTVIPLDDIGCINLSDRTPGEYLEITERSEIIQRIAPVLRSLGPLLRSQSEMQELALERLRFKYGQFRGEKRIGIFFLALDDLASYLDRFGPAFERFVAETYLPALLKRVSPYAVAESLKADDSYLLVIEDLLPPGTSVDDAFVIALDAISSFSRNEGSDLCLQRGYPPASLRLGVALGEVTLVCDSLKVRTTGRLINEARRLLDAAEPGTILAHGSTALSTGGWFGPEFFILQKKNTVPAKYLTLDGSLAVRKAG